MTQALVDGDSTSFKFQDFLWGSAVDPFAEWAKLHTKLVEYL